MQFVSTSSYICNTTSSYNHLRIKTTSESRLVYNRSLGRAAGSGWLGGIVWGRGGGGGDHNSEVCTVFILDHITLCNKMHNLTKYVNRSGQDKNERDIVICDLF